MHRYIATYLVTLLIFSALDFLWTRFVMGRFYRKPMGPIMLEHFLPPAIAAYHVLFVFGMMFAVVPHWVGDLTTGQIALRAFLYGAGLYGMLNMINFVYLHGAMLVLTLTDTAWGIALTVIAGSLGVVLGQMI